MTDDLFASRLVHGLVALVQDPASAAGIRFASVAHDLPEDCLSSVTALPDAEIVLRLFDSSECAKHYAAGVAEYGGNAVSAISSSENDGTNGRLVLIVRHDRARSPSDTIDEAIKLERGINGQARNSQKQDVASMIQSRAYAARRHGDELKEQAWRRAWAAELAVINAAPDFRSQSYQDFGPEAPLEIDIEYPDRRQTLSLRISRHQSGYLIRLGAAGCDFDSDLRSELDSLVNTSGFAMDGNHIIACFEFFEAAVLRAIGLEYYNLRASERILIDQQVSREHAQTILDDPNSRKTLERMALGLPLFEYLGNYGQISANTATTQRCSYKMLKTLEKGGWLFPVWQGIVNQDNFYVYLPTTAGLLLANGDKIAASKARKSVEHLTPKRESIDELITALSNFGMQLDQAKKNKLAVLSAKILKDAKTISFTERLPYNIAKADRFGAIMSGLLAGTLVVNETGLDHAVATHSTN